MWPGRSARHTDISDDIAFPYVVSRPDLKPRKVSKAGRDSVSVIDDDQVSIVGLPVGKNDYFVGRSANRRSICSRDVDTLMKFAAFAEWICPLAKGTEHCTFERPDVGCDTGTTDPESHLLMQIRHLTLQLIGSSLKRIDVGFRRGTAEQIVR